MVLTTGLAPLPPPYLERRDFAVERCDAPLQLPLAHHRGRLAGQVSGGGGAPRRRRGCGSRVGRRARARQWVPSGGAAKQSICVYSRQVGGCTPSQARHDHPTWPLRCVPAHASVPCPCPQTTANQHRQPPLCERGRWAAAHLLSSIFCATCASAALALRSELAMASCGVGRGWGGRGVCMQCGCRVEVWAGAGSRGGGRRAGGGRGEELSGTGRRKGITGPAAGGGAG